MQPHLFLIGTHAGLFKVLIDADLEVRSCERIRPGHHYAISVRPERELVYSKNRDEYLNVLAAKDLKKVDELAFRFEPSQVHQVLVVDHGVFVADTFNNRVTFQPETGPSTHYNIDDHDEDVNHVNSLFLRKGGVTAMLHNLGLGASELLDLDFGGGEFTQRQRRRLSDTRCHNVFLDGDQCLYNASDIGDFVVRDLHTDTDLRRVTFGGHTKGLSVLKDRVVIGVSENAPQERRGATTSGLAFLDREHHRVLKQVPLRDTATQSPIGNINEIRCLSHTDYSEGTPNGAPMPRPRQSGPGERLRAAARRVMRR